MSGYSLFFTGGTGLSDCFLLHPPPLSLPPPPPRLHDRAWLGGLVGGGEAGDGITLACMLQESCPVILLIEVRPAALLSQHMCRQQGTACGPKLPARADT